MNTILNFFKRALGLSTVPSWKKCTKSSNWAGKNAEQRMMNILSPHMSDGTFNARLAWMKSRGVNTAHVFIANKKDGECAGYCPYGKSFSWKIDKSYCKVMTARIKKLRKAGLAICLWLFSDDSEDWAKTAAKNFNKYCKDIKKLGWFKYASTVCLALEANEYYGMKEMTALAAAVRKYYKGKIATHHTSNKADFVNLGDLLFYQIDPTSNQSVVAKSCKKALSYGKPVNFFESYRCENRKNCETAFKCGCYAVGNY